MVAEEDNNRWIEYKDFTLTFYGGEEGFNELAYVEFFYNAGNRTNYKSSKEKFVACLRAQGATDGMIDKDLTWKGEEYVRCEVNCPSDVFRVLEALKDLIRHRDRINNIVRDFDDARLRKHKILPLLQLKEAMTKIIDNLDDDDQKRFAECDCRTYDYSYHSSGWACQRAPWQSYGIAEIQVFGNRGVEVENFFRYLNTSKETIPWYVTKWDGRMLFHFPLTTDDNYEWGVLELLSRWNNGKSYYLPDVHNLVNSIPLRNKMIEAVKQLAADHNCKEKVRTVYLAGQNQLDIREGNELDLMRPWLACGIPATLRRANGDDVECFACVVEQAGAYQVGLRRPPESNKPFGEDSQWYLQWKPYGLETASLQKALDHLKNQILNDKDIVLKK